jgi:hypothetical protein
MSQVGFRPRWRQGYVGAVWPVGSRTADPTTHSRSGIDARVARLEDVTQHTEAWLVRHKALPRR